MDMCVAAVGGLALPLQAGPCPHVLKPPPQAVPPALWMTLQRFAWADDGRYKERLLSPALELDCTLSWLIALC